MADPARVFTVDAIGQPEAVVIQTPCNTVRLVECGGSATQNLKLRRPLSSSVAIDYGVGGLIVIRNGRGLFQSGDVVGYLETDAGSISVCQTETIE